MTTNNRGRDIRGGLAEFARHRVLRFLVERLGFQAFCLESGVVKGFAVND